MSSADPPDAVSGDSEEDTSDVTPPLPDEAIVPGTVAPALAKVAPARKRPRPGERRVQILETLCNRLEDAL